MSAAPGQDAMPRPVDAIVIGASAGGVEALGQLLPALPAASHTPVFVVLHLPRERPSVLASLIGARCAVDVREAEDKEPVAPGTVYFAPPDYHLLIEAGPALALSIDRPVNYSRPSIDVLFESAADVYRDRLAGIVLTGANSDGALGLDAVRRAGGTTIVQDPEGALVATMPRAALARGPADFVWSLPRIAEWLSRTAPAPGKTAS